MSLLALAYDILFHCSLKIFYCHEVYVFVITSLKWALKY